jgi:hypothetical protein
MSLFQTRLKLKGEVTTSLYNTELYNTALKLMAKKNARGREILEKAKKKQWKENLVWIFLNRLLKKDIRIKYLTGNWTTDPIKRRNLITTAGKELVMNRLLADTEDAVVGMAIGTGSTAPVAGNTALGTEIDRDTAVATQITTTTTNDTIVFSKTFNFTDSYAVAEEGLLNSATTGGTLFARHTFPAYNVVNGDTLTVTHSIQIT